MTYTYSSCFMADGTLADAFYFQRSDGVLVPPTDADVVEWLAAGNTPAHPSIAPRLISTANDIQQGVAGGGITVNVGTSSAPVNVKAATDSASLTLLLGAHSMALANSSATFTWVQSDGTTQNLTAAQITAIFIAVNQFIQSTFTSLSKVISAINAGTITTPAGVLSPPPAVTTWPVNS